jgi:hypothetical protein
MVASAFFALALFVGMLILLDVGRRIGARQLASDQKGARTGTGTIEAAVNDLVPAVEAALAGKVCLSPSIQTKKPRKEKDNEKPRQESTLLHLGRLPLGYRTCFG